MKGQREPPKKIIEEIKWKKMKDIKTLNKNKKEKELERKLENMGDKRGRRGHGSMK